MMREHRLASFLLSFVLLLPAWANAEDVQGTITRSLFQLSLVGPDGTSYRLTTRSTEALKTLNRLESGDSIVASGRIDSANLTAEIESIDFVGLKKIIGTWKTMNTKGLMKFKSYSDVNMSSHVLPNKGGGAVGSHKNFKYTVTPSSKGDWVMFLSDESSTQMSLLNIEDTDATISFLNSQTGDVSNVIHLHKIGN